MSPLNRKSEYMVLIHPTSRLSTEHFESPQKPLYCLWGLHLRWVWVPWLDQHQRASWFNDLITINFTTRKFSLPTLTLMLGWTCTQQLLCEIQAAARLQLLQVWRFFFSLFVLGGFPLLMTRHSTPRANPYTIIDLVPLYQKIFKHVKIGTGKLSLGGGAKRDLYLMDGLTSLDLSSPPQEGTSFW